MEQRTRPERPASAALLVATHNAGKLDEFLSLLAPLGLTAKGASELRLAAPRETAPDFAGNARIKAAAAVRASGRAALADDSGLTVAALDGAPGILSARWAGAERDFARACARVQRELRARGAKDEGAEAEFICALALAWPERTDGRAAGDIVHMGRVAGRLTFPPRGDKGFGYDPIFVPHGETRTFGEIDPAEKEAMSHRALAFARFAEWWGTLSAARRRDLTWTPTP